jgi:hypothetical protein
MSWQTLKFALVDFFDLILLHYSLRLSAPGLSPMDLLCIREQHVWHLLLSQDHAPSVAE